LRLALRLVHAELTSRIRDKSFWLEALLLPVVVTAIMGLSLGNLGRGKTPPVRVGIVANSERSMAVEILQSALKSAGSIHTEFYSDPAGARSQLTAAHLDALVFLPDLNLALPAKDLSLKAIVESGKRGQFQAEMVAEITEATFRAMSAELAARTVVADMMTESGVDPAPAWTIPTPVAVSTRLQEVPLQRFDLLAAQFAGLAIFFSLLSAFRIMSNVFGEHRRGLNLRLAGVPAPAYSVAAGFILTVATVALLQTFTVLLLGAVGFQVRWGPVLPLFLATLVTALASAAVALALAVLPGSSTSRGLVGMLFVLGGGAIGGALVPLDGANPVLQIVAHATLHFWATGLFTGLARGLTFLQVLSMFLGVLAYGAVAFCLAAIFLARRRVVRA
jgi:ABC-type multidrug transport system permease subunit